MNDRTRSRKSGAGDGRRRRHRRGLRAGAGARGRRGRGRRHRPRPPPSARSRRSRREGGRAIALQVDLGDEASVIAMVEATAAQLGGLDILHNNAADTRLSSTCDRPVDHRRHRGLGRDPAHQPARHDDRVPGGDPAPAPARRRRDRQHQLERGARRRALAQRLQRLEGRDQLADAEHRDAARQGRHPLQRDLAGADRHAVDEGQLCRLRRRRDHAAAPPDAAARAARGHRGRRGLPRLRRGRIHHRPGDLRRRRLAGAPALRRRLRRAEAASSHADGRSGAAPRPASRPSWRSSNCPRATPWQSIRATSMPWSRSSPPMWTAAAGAPAARP